MSGCKVKPVFTCMCHAETALMRKGTTYSVGQALPYEVSRYQIRRMARKRMAD